MNLKIKNLFTICFFVLMIDSVLYSQKGKALLVEYKTIRLKEPDVRPQDNQIDPQMKKQVKEMVNDVLKMRFHLFCNDSIAVFKKIDEITSDIKSPIERYFNSGVFTVDFNKKEVIKHTESLGEYYRVLYPFEQYKWEITSETKEINGYMCYKATTTKSVYSQLKNRMVTTTPTVWFTPAIPVTAGPFGLNGLPGLILEATLNKNLYYIATSIQLDYKQKDKKEFVIPKKGKIVTEAELEGIQVNLIKNN